MGREAPDTACDRRAAPAPEAGAERGGRRESRGEEREEEVVVVVVILEDRGELRGSAVPLS